MYQGAETNRFIVPHDINEVMNIVKQNYQDGKYIKEYTQITSLLRLEHKVKYDKSSFVFPTYFQQDVL